MVDVKAIMLLSTVNAFNLSCQPNRIKKTSRKLYMQESIVGLRKESVPTP